MNDRTRLALLAGVALVVGAGLTIVVAFQGRFLWVAYQHGGFM